MPDKKQNPSHIAIIGCGFTGTTTLYQLVHNHPVQRITIFESSGIFGPGFPYQTSETREYLLNNSNDSMCLEPTNRRAFVEWLHKHPDYATELDEKASMPRAVYGEFLIDVIRQTVDEGIRRSIRVDFISEEVIDLDDLSDDEVTLHTASGTYTADVAILATGRCPDRDAYEFDDAPEDRYFPLHIPGANLAAIPGDATVHVLGASLSAYDVVNQLFAPETGCRFVADGPNRLRFEPHGNQRKVVLCSRSGRLKKIQSRHPFPVQPKHFSLAALEKLGNRSATLEQIFELIEKDAIEYGAPISRAELSDPYAGCASLDEVNGRAEEMLCRDIDAAASPAESTANFAVDYLNVVQLAVWDLFAAKVLSADAEAEFRSTWESPMLNYAAPCPSLTAQRILALLQAGRLRIMNGVRSIEMPGNSKPFRIAHRYGVEDAAYVVNASGVVDRWLGSEWQSQLLVNLYAKGLLHEYRGASGPAYGAEVDLQSFQSSGSRKILVANMLLWGPGFYVSSAIMMATIVQRLLAAAFAPEQQ